MKQTTERFYSWSYLTYMLRARSLVHKFHFPGTTDIWPNKQLNMASVLPQRSALLLAGQSWPENAALLLAARSSFSPSLVHYHLISSAWRGARGWNIVAILNTQDAPHIWNFSVYWGLLNDMDESIDRERKEHNYFEWDEYLITLENRFQSWKTCYCRCNCMLHVYVRVSPIHVVYKYIYQEELALKSLGYWGTTIPLFGFNQPQLDPVAGLVYSVTEEPPGWLPLLAGRELDCSIVTGRRVIWPAPIMRSARTPGVGAFSPGASRPILCFLFRWIAAFCL